jgi:dTDP-4-dehydrorhamnose reductase
VSRRIVLLTGASGLVGTWLRRTVPADADLVPSVHRTAVASSACVTADLRDSRAVSALFTRVRPSLVIHAAMAVDAASIVGATTNVVQGASLVGADVVFVSTDAVFSGDGRPRDERAEPDPVWDYGRWKAQAEEVVLREATGSAVVRVPLVVSLDPEDRAVERIRCGALQHQPTSWFHDEIRQPAMASDIAEGIWRIASLRPDQRSGPWQLPGPESVSRYEIARRVTDALELDPSWVLPVPTPLDAARPRHIDMQCDRAKAEIRWDPARILT